MVRVNPVTGVQNAQVGAAMPFPQTGLMGSEAALRGGMTGALSNIGAGINQARQDIYGGVNAGAGILQQAMNQLNTQPGSPATMQPLPQMASPNIAQGLAGAKDAYNRGMGSLKYIGRGVDTLNKFVDPGLDAQQQMANLLGVAGPEAQAAAMTAFQESPATAFLREQGERAVLANAAATGGTQGGNVLKELTRFGTGLANQSFNDRLAQLSGMTGQSLTAAGQAGQLQAERARLGAQLADSLGSRRTALEQARMGEMGANQRALLGETGSMNRARLGESGATDRARMGLLGTLAGQGADLYSRGGTQLADLSTRGGFGAADLISDVAKQTAAGRTRAGEQIAGAVGDTTSNLAKLIAQQGGGLSDLIGSNAGNIAHIIQSAGAGEANAQEQLAAMLGNLQTGQAAQVSALPALGQFGPQANNLSSVASVLSGGGTMLEMLEKLGAFK